MNERQAEQRVRTLLLNSATAAVLGMAATPSLEAELRTVSPNEAVQQLSAGQLAQVRGGCIVEAGIRAFYVDKDGRPLTPHEAVINRRFTLSAAGRTATLVTGQDGIGVDQATSGRLTRFEASAGDTQKEGKPHLTIVIIDHGEKRDNPYLRSAKCDTRTTFQIGIDAASQARATAESRLTAEPAPATPTPKPTSTRTPAPSATRVIAAAATETPQSTIIVTATPNILEQAGRAVDQASQTLRGILPAARAETPQPTEIPTSTPTPTFTPTPTSTPTATPANERNFLQKGWEALNLFPPAKTATPTPTPTATLTPTPVPGVLERIGERLVNVIAPLPTVPPTPLPTPEPRAPWEFWKGQPEAPKPPSPAAAASSQRENSGSKSNLLSWPWLDEQPIIGGIVKPARAEATKVYEIPVLGGVMRVVLGVGEFILDLPSKIVSIVQNVEVPGVRWMINAGFFLVLHMTFGIRRTARALWNHALAPLGGRLGGAATTAWRTHRNRRTPPGPTIVP